MRSVTCCLLKKGVPNTPGPKLITGAQYLRVTMPPKQGWPYLCIAVNEKSGWISCSTHRLLASSSLICFARVGNEAHLHWKRRKHTQKSCSPNRRSGTHDFYSAAYTYRYTVERCRIAKRARYVWPFSSSSISLSIGKNGLSSVAGLLGFEVTNNVVGVIGPIPPAAS